MRIGYFVDFLIENELPTLAPEVTRDHIGRFIESLLTRPNKRCGKSLSPEYARSNYRALQQFFKYLAVEGIITTDPFDKMTLPDAPESLTAVPPDEALRALLAACAGTDFEALRDTAIIRMFTDTGCRAGELAGLDIPDIDFAENTAMVIGKGRRPRTAPFGDKTRVALRKYLRARAKHPKAKNDETALWLGRQGRMTDHGFRQMLERRATAAGIDHIHPHQFRHWFAHTWLANGGQEQDLMMLAGWRSRQMRRQPTAAPGSATNSRWLNR